MTSKIFRNDPLFLRNEFETEGRWGFPIIKKQQLDVNDIELISCSDVSKKDDKNLHKGMHFIYSLIKLILKIILIQKNLSLFSITHSIVILNSSHSSI